MDEIVAWICKELAQFLATDANEDMARYILSMGDARDLEDYMYDILGNDSKAKNFVGQLVVMWRKSKCIGSTGKKAEAEQSLSTKSNQNVKSSKLKGAKSKTSEKVATQIMQTSKQEDKNEKEEITNFAENTSNVSSSGSKKKSSFVPLFSSVGQQRTAAKLPGRHQCDCQAMKHALINNCLGCGRVVCAQEGSGPCLFCHDLVCTNDELEVLNRGSKKSTKLMEKLMGTNQSDVNSDSSDTLNKAVAHKNRLLEYDRTSAKRTQVIDDESDYFASDSNQWLNAREREILTKREGELRSQRHGSRLDRKVTLDFAGRRVVEESNNVNMYDPNDSVVQEVNFGRRNWGGDENLDPQLNLQNDAESIVNPTIAVSAPVFVADNEQTKKRETVRAGGGGKQTALRVQDAELQQMSDLGMAMSMHQPWASLLVAGIKRHEGRPWYTAHRGVLWIAATAKPPSPDEIKSLEHQYRSMYGDSVSFPAEYPAGCLLGCVDVVDCLAQQDYREKFPDGESESPYVFICENPRSLVVKFPIKGRHKIYKLDGTIHKAAKKGLSR